MYPYQKRMRMRMYPYVSLPKNDEDAHVPLCIPMYPYQKRIRMRVYPYVSLPKK